MFTQVGHSTGTVLLIFSNILAVNCFLKVKCNYICFNNISLSNVHCIKQPCSKVMFKKEITLKLNIRFLLKSKKICIITSCISQDKECRITAIIVLHHVTHIFKSKYFYNLYVTLNS